MKHLALFALLLAACGDKDSKGGDESDTDTDADAYTDTDSDTDADSDTADGTFLGDAAGFLLGSAVSSAGDIDGDGLSEVIVGGPDRGTGHAWAFFGGLSGTAARRTRSLPLITTENPGLLVPRRPVRRTRSDNRQTLSAG